MHARSVESCDTRQYELRFCHLFQPGRGYSFPCDADGCVDMDALGDSLRNTYLLARALVGHELRAPVTGPSCVLVEPGNRESSFEQRCAGT
jgi:hypothetical protein